jgi:hypothetical protein
MISKVLSSSHTVNSATPPSTPEIQRRIARHKETHSTLVDLDKDLFLSKLLLHLRLSNEVENTLIAKFLEVKALIVKEEIALNDKDILFTCVAKILFAQAPLDDQKTSIEGALKKCTNGYFLPRGQIIVNFLKEPSTPEVLEASVLSQLADQLNSVQNFSCTLIFPTLKTIIKANLYNQFQKIPPVSGEAALNKVRADLLQWTKDSHFNKKQVITVEKGDFAKLAWLAIPHIEDPKLILLYAQFLTFLFFHDDIGDNRTALDSADSLAMVEERNNLFKAIFKGTGDPSLRNSTDPLIICAFELSDEISRIISETPPFKDSFNFDFFNNTLKSYFDFTTEETKEILHDQILGISGYAPKRVETSALKVCFALSAILSTIPVSQTQVEQRLNEVIYYGDLYVSYCNDLVSFVKEIQSTSYSLTMMFLLEQAKSAKIIDLDVAFIDEASLQDIFTKNPTIIRDAISMTIATIHSTYFSYIQKNKALRDPSDIQFAEQVIRPWMIGNAVWQEESDRYLNKSSFKGNLTEYVGHLLTTDVYQLIKVGQV